MKLSHWDTIFDDYWRNIVVKDKVRWWGILFYIEDLDNYLLWKTCDLHWCQFHGIDAAVQMPLAHPITCFVTGYTVLIYSWVVLVVPRSQILVRVSTCISTCMYVHLTAHICSTPFSQLNGNMSLWGPKCVLIPPHLVRFLS